MKALIALASLTLFATPVGAQSLPTWSIKVAESTCTYLGLNVNLKNSISQAYDDNDHWQTEMTASHERGLLGKTVIAALKQQCPYLYLKADRT